MADKTTGRKDHIRSVCALCFNQLKLWFTCINMNLKSNSEAHLVQKPYIVKKIQIICKDWQKACGISCMRMHKLVCHVQCLCGVDCKESAFQFACFTSMHFYTLKMLVAWCRLPKKWFSFHADLQWKMCCDTYAIFVTCFRMNKDHQQIHQRYK